VLREVSRPGTKPGAPGLFACFDAKQTEEFASYVSRCESQREFTILLNDHRDAHGFFRKVKFEPSYRIGDRLRAHGIRNRPDNKPESLKFFDPCDARGDDRDARCKRLQDRYRKSLSVRWEVNEGTDECASFRHLEDHIGHVSRPEQVKAWMPEFGSVSQRPSSDDTNSMLAQRTGHLDGSRQLLDSLLPDKPADKEKRAGRLATSLDDLEEARVDRHRNHPQVTLPGRKSLEYGPLIPLVDSGDAPCTLEPELHQAAKPAVEEEHIGAMKGDDILKLVVDNSERAEQP